MNRMIFVNLPVADLDRSTAFYTGLGFTVNPQFTDDTAACIVVSDTIFLMMLTRTRFSDFVVGDIAEAGAGTEIINCLSAKSRDEVDQLVGAALASGGSTWLDKMDEGPMYGHSFADPDGHAWEVLYMDMAQVS